MVGAVPTTGGTGTQRGPVCCPYGHGRGSPNNRRYGHPKGPVRCPYGHGRGSPNNRRYGHPKGPVRCPYGLHTGKGAGHVQRPHRAPYSARTLTRMGPVPFCPYRSRTVLPLPVPYRFASIGPVPLCPTVSLTTPYAPMEPASRASSV